MVGHYNTESSPITKLTIKNSYSTTALKGGDIVANSSLESFSGNKRLTEAQLVSAAVSLGNSYIYDCEWENSGYPVLSWECDTLLPEDLVLTTAAQLRRLAYEVNSGTSDFSGKVILLGKDIDLQSREWIPIGGNNAEDSGGKAFRGTFDGQGYSVSNVYISSGYHYVGFFGNVIGNVKNFGIETGSVTGGNKSAGLAGYCRGTISACYSRATVSGTANAGGLVGMTGKIRISDSYAVASVTATGNAGGLVGYLSSGAMDSTIQNSYAACSLSGKTCGGLLASVNTSATGVAITNSYALSGPSFLGSATGCTLNSASSQSADNLKAKAETLGAAFLPDSYIPQNSGYPVLASSAYKTPNMTALPPSEEGIYEIRTAQELRQLAYTVNVLGDTFAGKTVRLLSDIDLKNEEWIPIGGNAVVSGGACSKFSGIFEGGGHKICNLTISGGNYYVGFFGRLEKGQVHNLGIDSGMVMGTSRVAGLVGSFNGGSLISGCYNKANVFGQSYTGGIVGMAGGENSQIINCYNTGSVGSNSNDGNGGIVGYVSSGTKGLVIQNCYNVGIVSSGIAALINESAVLTVENCYTLDTAELTGAGTNLTLTNSSKLSAAALRDCASALGSAYAEDFFTQNRIYPVLAWENGDRSTTVPEENGVYTIDTPDQLRLVSYAVRKGNTFQGKTIVLRADLDLQNRPWLPIGGKDETTTYYFRGTVDGKGHRIHNLNATDLQTGYAGLFGAVRNATIQNLGIESGIVTGYTRSAAIAAYVHEGSTIRNCYNKATVFANSDVGSIAGIIGGQNVLIENCYNTGVVFAKARTSSGAGLIGYGTNSAHNLTVRNCYNVGNYFGIISRVGDSATNVLVENSYSVGTVALHRLWASPNYADTKQISADALKTYAVTLGFAYETDSQSINGGYPVLSWENTPDTVEPLLDTALKINHTLNLASDISINFAVAKSLLEGFDMDTVYLEVSAPVYESNMQTGTETITILPVEQGNYYYFTLEGLTAVHMNNKLSSILYGSKNGQVYYSPTDIYSIADYAYSQLNKSNAAESLKALCADLLRYGSAAQIYKNYRTDALADRSMTASHKAYLSDVDTVSFGNNNQTLSDIENPVITWAGKALNLESKVSVKYIFNLGSYAGKVENLSLKVHYINYAGTVTQVTLTAPEVYDAAKNRYAFSFDGLLAAELRAVVDVAIYDGSTQLSQTLRYSPDTYGNNKKGTLLDLCKALFAYSDSAKAYFVK